MDTQTYFESAIALEDIHLDETNEFKGLCKLFVVVGYGTDIFNAEFFLASSHLNVVGPLFMRLHNNRHEIDEQILKNMHASPQHDIIDVEFLEPDE